MKILIAPDKFKGVADSPKIAGILQDALQRRMAGARISLCPLADGGDGTLSALLCALNGKRITASVHDPLQRLLNADYGVLPSLENKTAVVEMAEASGLTLLSAAERNPLRTSTYGTGELVLDAVTRQGCGNLYVTLGGSATVDGGLGFLQALGAVFEADPPLPPGAGGAALPTVHSADLAPALRNLRGAALTGLTDVQNPLLGPGGAARMYGPQKGATREMVESLEAGLAHFGKILSQACGDQHLGEIRGSGAAGGLGLALTALGGTLRGGFDFVAEALKLEEQIRQCDLVVTGEGRLDDSTRQGKTVVGVSRLAKKWNIPCVAVVGVKVGKLTWLKEEGIEGVYPLFDTPFIGDDPRKSEVPERLAQAAVSILRDRNP